MTNINSCITLTKLEMDVAERIYNRHKLLTKFLPSLGVSEKNAAADACKIEHDSNDETFEKLKEHAKQYLQE